MDLISKASHTHLCPTCQKPWVHPGYSCGHYAEAPCTTCEPPPPRDDPSHVAESA